MEFLEPKSRQKFPNESFANFYPVEAAKRIFCELFLGKNGQTKLLATFTG